MRLRPKICLFSVAVFTIIALSSTPLSGQSFIIVKKTKTYIQQTREDSLHKMIEVKTLLPAAVYDLRYATTDNFTKQQLYKQRNNTFLRLPAAAALANVQQELNTHGFGIKIFDAYRPYSVTKKMWELVKDGRYVAHPSKGSGHNRGLAIDLTLIDQASGKEADMGTGFDHFSDTAHHSFTALPQQVLNNRRLLKETMTRHGFLSLSTEWWHYSWPNDRNYAVLDLSFKELAKSVY